jgi:hypothetical protein
MARLVPAWVSAAPSRTTEIKGLREPVEIWGVRLADHGDDPVTDPVCGLVVPGEAALVGADGGRYCSQACAETGH